MKLIDFGAGHWAKSGPLVADKFIGTLQFMAPEVIIARGDDFDASDPSQVESTVAIEFKKRPLLGGTLQLSHSSNPEISFLIVREPNDVLQRGLTSNQGLGYGSTSRAASLAALLVSFGLVVAATLKS